MRSTSYVVIGTSPMKTKNPHLGLAYTLPISSLLSRDSSLKVWGGGEEVNKRDREGKCVTIYFIDPKIKSIIQRIESELNSHDFLLFGFPFMHDRYL